jgi:hypothetical protein
MAIGGGGGGGGDVVVAAIAVAAVNALQCISCIHPSELCIGVLDSRYEQGSLGCDMHTPCIASQLRIAR